MIPGVIFEVSEDYTHMANSNTISVLTFQKNLSFTVNDIVTDFQRKKICVVNLSEKPTKTEVLRHFLQSLSLKSSKSKNHFLEKDAVVY